jgi:hypothetical protein
LFSKRHEKSEDEDPQELKAQESKALESAMTTAQPKGAMGGVEEKVEAKSPKKKATGPPENWKSKKHGPYDNPNALLVRT